MNRLVDAQATGLARGLAAGLVKAPAKLIARARTRSSSNFRFAFGFLRPDQQRALKDVYAFCRVVDDIVDEPELLTGDLAGDPAMALEHWRGQVERLFSGRCDTPGTERLMVALADSYQMFAYDKSAFLDIIAGCEMDLNQQIYQTQAELELYCYRVASCVGLLCIAIFQETSPAAQSYAKELGLALQYTNILRDVAEDAQRGRVYLPADVLARFDLRSEDILACRYDERFIRFGQYFFEKAQSHYDAAKRHFETVPAPGRLFVAEIMGQTYHRILMELKEMNFDVFTRRPSLRRRDKLQAACSAAFVRTLPSVIRARRRR